MDILILGGGLVGGPIALDLSKEKDFTVSVADLNKDALERIEGKNGIRTVVADVTNHGALKELLDSCDLVVNAVPGFLGFGTLQLIIAAGKSGVDIAFMPEEFWKLDGEAKSNNVTIIPDMGVAPGWSNMLCGYATKLLDKTDSLKILVGGLPKVRKWPYQYKAVFSPVDVIEEYTRPSLMVENGRKVIKPALTEPERIEMEGVGTLEAFNSDGLRSLAHTLDVPWMVEKTLRYPGHRELMEILRETGFFSQEEIEVSGKKVKPLDLASKLLFREWKLNPGDEDITVMKIIAEGKKDDKKAKLTFDLYDEYDRASGVHSMARTTGYTAAMAVRMLAKGMVREKGIILAEKLAKDASLVEFIWKGLTDRGIRLSKKIELTD